MNRRTRTACWIVALLAVASCSSSKEDEVGTREYPRPNYHEDVRPILAAHCVECHHAEDSVTQMVSLAGYEDAVAAAPLIKQQASEHGMPLWGLDNSGSCGKWANARWLEPAERETLSRWVDLGTPLGDPARAAPLGASPRRWSALAHVDATLDPGASYTPQLGSGVVRCFVVDPALLADRFLTGVEISPSRPWSVEQVTLYALGTPEAEAAAAQLDASDADPGYECLADTRVPDSKLLIGTSWIDAGSAPWTTRLPDGLGLRMKAGRKVVMQVHYNLISGMEPDRSVVRLELSDSVREACWSTVQASPFLLEPGRDLVGAQRVVSVGRDVEAHAVYPRMRFLGKKMRVSSDDRCLADVFRWNQHGLQHFYALDRPFPIAAFEPFQVSCTYTTLGLDAPVENGSGADDEECALHLLVTPC